MDDPGAWAPESEAEAGRSTRKEGVYVMVGVEGRFQIRLFSLRGPQQVITVNRGRNIGLVTSGQYELEHGHLGCGVLQGHTVRQKTDRSLSPYGDPGVLGVGLVEKQDFLRIGQAPAELLSLQAQNGLDVSAVEWRGHGVFSV